MKKWLTAISVGLAVAAAVYLLNWPIYKNYAGKKATLVEVNGAWALVPVSLPILLTLLHSRISRYTSRSRLSSVPSSTSRA